MRDELQLGYLSNEFLVELRNVLDEKVQTCHGLKNTSWAAAARQHVDYEAGIRLLQETINTLQSTRDNRQRLEREREGIDAAEEANKILAQDADTPLGKDLFRGFFKLSENDREAFSYINHKLNSSGFCLSIRKLRNGSVEGS